MSTLNEGDVNVEGATRVISEFIGVRIVDPRKANNLAVKKNIIEFIGGTRAGAWDGASWCRKKQRLGLAPWCG